MAHWMRAVRGGAVGVAAALWAGAALGAPMPQDTPPAASEDSEAPEDYGWIDRADALWEAIGDAPPDYSFAFENGEPWAWETEDGSWVVAEDTPEGMLSYYFDPGSEGPFLVREAERSFGYDGGEVAMVYDAGGGALPRAEGAAFLDEGGELYDRGVRLRAMLGERNWQPVDTTAWADVSVLLIGLQTQWDLGRRRHFGWQRYRALPQVIVRHRHWDGEHRRRVEMGAQFRRWREGGYKGTPPGRPGGWVHRPHRPDRADGRPGRPGWRQTRPTVPGVVPQPVPGAVVTRPPVDGAGRPGRPGWRRPPSGGVAGPDGVRVPDRPGRRPPPGGKLSDGPAVTSPAPAPDARTGRGWWRNGDGSPRRDRPSRPVAPVAPAAPVVTAPAPAQPEAQAPRPTRPMFRPRPSADGTAPGAGFQRPDRRPEGFARPPRPAFTPSPAPSAAPAPQRPAYTRPSPGFSVPPAGRSAPTRPSYAPPPQRPTAAPAPQPAPRSAPPRPAKVERGGRERVD